MADTTMKRSGLKVLQQSSSHTNILPDSQIIQTTQKKRKLSTSSSQKKHKTGSTFSVFTDTVREDIKENRCSLCEDKGVNTDETCIEVKNRISADDLTSENAGIDYWKELAETRRQALEKALEENEQLHNKEKTLTDKVTELQEENKKYEQLAEHAEQLADTIKVLTGLCEENDDTADKKLESEPSTEYEQISDKTSDYDNSTESADDSSCEEKVS